jgi:hypothetical protein
MEDWNVDLLLSFMYTVIATEKSCIYYGLRDWLQLLTFAVIQLNVLQLISLYSTAITPLIKNFNFYANIYRNATEFPLHKRWR